MFKKHLRNGQRKSGGEQEPHDLPPWGAQGHVGAIPKQDTAAPVRQLVAKAVLAGMIDLSSPCGSPHCELGDLKGSGLPEIYLVLWAKRCFLTSFPSLRGSAKALPPFIIVFIEL